MVTVGWFNTPVSSQTHKLMAATKVSDYLGQISIFEIKIMVKKGVIFMSVSNPTCHFSDTTDFTVTSVAKNLSHICYCNRRYVLYVLYVKSAVSLKWQVGFENDMKITPIFTIIFSSKMPTRQCFTSLEHTFLVDGLNSTKLI